VLLLVGAALVVTGVGCWSVAAALVCAGVLAMAAAVALATLQEAAQARQRLSGPQSNGTTSQPEEAVR
jgi:membrane protein implicated in regulation of membrane protease activity